MKILVESCFHLGTKLLKKDLRLAREHKAGAEGFINISFGNTKSVADYYIEYSPEYDYLVIQYGEGEQRIKLAESELHLGARSWFICDCGCRVGKLYLPPHAKEFKCRRCHGLVYELTTFNRSSKLGQFGYMVNRRLKLINMRENMRSILYDGKPTQCFDRFLRLSDKAGLGGVVEDARNLLLALK